MIGRCLSILALIAAASVSAQLVDWQEQYFAGMRALQEGRYLEARTLLDVAYDRARTPPVDEIWTARTAFGVGSLAGAEGDAAKATDLLDQARYILERRADSQVLLASVLNGLGEAYLDEARWDDAEQVFSRAAKIFESDAAWKRGAFLSRRHLAEIRFMHEEYDACERLLKPLIAEERQDAGGEDLASALTVLGRVYTVQRRWKDGERAFREAVEIRVHVSEDSAGLADTQLALATLYRSEGHPERAEPLLRKCIKRYETRADPRVVGAYLQLSWCARDDGKYGTAKELLQKAIAIASKASMAEVAMRKLRQELADVAPEYAKTQSSRP